MQETAFRSSTFAATALGSLAMLGAVAALAVVAAYWTWIWFAPRPEPAAQTPVPALARLEAAPSLFGNVQMSRSSAAPAGTAFKLLGLVAASGRKPGYAVLTVGGNRPIAVPEGGEIEPGTRLVEVNADHVVLDRGGMRETLALPSRGRNAATGAGHAR